MILQNATNQTRRVVNYLSNGQPIFHTKYTRHKVHYPASDSNVEVWLVETNTISNDIMPPY